MRKVENWQNIMAMSEWEDSKIWDDAWLQEDIWGKYFKSHEPIFREVPKHFRGEVADLGCGIGIMGLFAGSYYGCDFSPVAIERAKRAMPKLEFAVVDLRQGVPKKDKSFHTVVAVEVVEHFKDYSFLLSEAKRLAKSRIILTVPVNMPLPNHFHPTWDIKKCVNEFSGLGEIVIIQKIGLWWMVVIDVTS